MDDASQDASVRLAANILQLRRKQSLTQALLAKRAAIPRSTLGNLESGEGNPSLSNLTRLAAALRVSVEELLAAPRPACVLIRAKELPTSDRGRGSVALTRLLPDAIPGLEIERMELLPGAFMRGVPHLEGTKEYLTALEGTTRVTVEGEDYDVTPGDVLAFPGDRRHSYHNPTGKKSRTLSVIAWIPAN